MSGETDKFTFDATIVYSEWEYEHLRERNPADENTVEVGVKMIGDRSQKLELRAVIPTSLANEMMPNNRVRITIEPITSDAASGEGEG